MCDSSRAATSSSSAAEVVPVAASIISCRSADTAREPSAAARTAELMSSVARICSCTVLEIDEELRSMSVIERVMSAIERTTSSVAPWMRLIWLPMSSVAPAVWFDSAFTSEATTAKLRPALPARTASIVAFSASSRVWPAIFWIRPLTRPMLLVQPASSRTVPSARCTSCAVWCASSVEALTRRPMSPIDSARPCVDSAMRLMRSAVCVEAAAALVARSTVRSAMRLSDSAVEASSVTAAASVCATPRIEASKECASFWRRSSAVCSETLLRCISPIAPLICSAVRLKLPRRPCGRIGRKYLSWLA